MSTRTTVIATPQDFPTIWEMLVELSKTPGPPGPIGPQGVPGVVGPQGPTTVAIGTTTTGAAGSNAAVANVGTGQAMILNFTIPQGATGATGSPGSSLVTSVAGKTGAVTLVKGDVGLGSVDNTADTAKPVSTAQQTAINGRQDVSVKNVANGYAGLDSGGKVALSQIPLTITPAFSTLTDGATITWTMQASQVTQNAVVTLGGTRALVFSGIAAGMNGTLVVKQDATGGRTLSLPAGSKVINGGAGAIVLSLTAAAIDILTFIYDGTNYFWTLGKNYT